MVRYRKNIQSGVVRLPKELRDTFGDEMVIAPNLTAAAIYPSGTKKKAVIKSLQLVIQDLRNEILLEKEKNERGESQAFVIFKEG